MSHWCDLSPEREAVGLCVVLPGRAYTAARPLLDFATLVALQHGWAVRQVWWEPAEHPSSEETAAWVGDELVGATQGYGGRVLVVAKSLGCYGAATAAESGYDAVWLTPVLTDPVIVEALSTPGGRHLVLGGGADFMWVSSVASGLPGDVVEIEGGDHSMCVPGDAARSAELHAEVVRRIDVWLDALVVD